MRVRSGGDVIGAVFEDICFIDVGVVGDEIFEVDGNCYGNACARLDIVGLGEADEAYRRLFNAVLPVVFGIGRLHINLHYLFAPAVAGVSDIERNGHISVRIGFREIEVSPLESCVRKTVAEGVLNGLGIIIIAGVAVAEHPVFVARFVILIADVNTFGIVYVVIVGALVVIIAHILHGGRREAVVYDGVDEMTGGRNFVSVPVQTREHVTQSVSARSARAREGDYGGDIVVIFHPAHLHDVVCVDEDYYVVESSVEVIYNFKFGAVGLQVMLPRLTAVSRHVPCEVGALAARARKHEHRHGSVKSILQAGLAQYHGERALVYRPVERSAVIYGAFAALVIGTVAAFVEVPESLVYFKPRGFKPRFEVCRKFKAARAGSRTAAYEVDGRVAEKAYSSVLSEGKHAVVFEQRCALHCHVGNDLLFVFIKFCGAAERALVILNVCALGVARRTVGSFAERLFENVVELAEGKEVENERYRNYQGNAY